MTTKTTHKGPRGAKLHIDPSRYYPDDPGQDTPAQVEYHGEWGSYHCVVDTGEIGDGDKLPADVLRWLESDTIVDAVESIYC